MIDDFHLWASEKWRDHSEILIWMRNSLDPLDRAIAIHIMKAAGVDPAEYLK